MMRSLSLRARLTVWYSLTLLLALSLCGAAVVWDQARIGLRRIDRQLENDLSTLTNLFKEELRESGDANGAALDVLRTVSTAGRVHAILDQNGAELAARWNGLHLQDTVRASDGSRFLTADTPNGSWRIRVRPEPIEQHTFVLLVAAPLNDAFRERRESIETLWVGIPLALLLAMTGGLWLASVGLRPITEMARRASDLPVSGMEDLGQSDRLDELGQLARAFNGLLARLRQALHSQRQFMADASHEFRTPVSVIQSAADVALARERRDELEYREALSITHDQAKRLSVMVDDMLVLARADAGGYPLRPVALYLNELVADCLRTLTGLALERGVTLDNGFSGDTHFVGDEELLRRMLLNLLQNAAQHTRSGGVVRISASTSANSVIVRVSDQGEGIPDEEQAKIFERFVQLDSSRRRAGAGLGLPIARWIAEVHHGRLDLESSSPNGSVFRVELPASTSRGWLS